VFGYALGPVIVTGWVIAGRLDARVIVPAGHPAKLIVLPEPPLAEVIAARSDPAPLSFRFVTEYVLMD
jgi:hypothetical protein